jgi:membrane associated rhomboid family serine protease
MSNPTPPPPVPAPTCARHPGRVASVVCARCDRPICTDCMIHASVGWQCPDCVSQGAKKSPTQRVTFNRARTGAVGSTNPTPAVITLVAINALVFVASGFGRASVIDRFGEWPYGIHAYHQYYRLFDSMFLHLNFLHIIGNMIALLIVGPAVEVLLGRTRFVALYLIGGLGGAACYYLIAPVDVPAAGASGAIFGIMGAYVVLARRRRLPTQQVMMLIGLNLIIGFADPNIGWQAHLGGLIVGGLLALVYDLAEQLRPRSRVWVVTALSSAATLGILAVLVLAIAPGHLNLSG